MSRKDLSVVKKYGVSKAKYRELMYFCMQYCEMKDSQPEKIMMIEESAKEASPELYKYILQSVTQGTPYEYMDAPCGRNQFYNAKRKFFYRLSLKR